MDTELSSFGNILIRILFFGIAAAATIFSAGESRADTFTTVHFIDPGEWSAGLEPVVTLNNGAGVGFNARFGYGLSDISNLTGVLGTGSGPRQFRAGGIWTFDIFPDVDNQPGIGLALQGFYMVRPDGGHAEFTGMPYIHKTFVSSGSQIEPYVAVPYGIGLFGGQYQVLTTVAVGSLFKGNDHFRYGVEFGISVNNADTYVSGGISYYSH